MATLNEIKLNVLRYLQIDSPVLESHPLFGEGDPDAVAAMKDALAIKAIQNGQKWAERQHDFMLADATVTVQVPATGEGVLIYNVELPDLLNPNVTHKIKSINNVYWAVENGTIPIELMEKKQIVEQLLQRRRQSTFPGYIEEGEWVQSDDEIANSIKVYHYGGRLYTFPARAVVCNLVLDVNEWVPQLESGEQTNFFTEWGEDFLMWSAIVELNHLTKTFVQRQEGNLSPPEKMRDSAFISLVEWDNYMRQGGSNPRYE